ncbi:hypothetical protein [Sphingobacterium kyonggiense]
MEKYKDKGFIELTFGDNYKEMVNIQTIRSFREDNKEGVLIVFNDDCSDRFNESYEELKQLLTK